MTTMLLALALTCGQERWAVKVLADDDATRVALSEPVAKTVEDLVGQPPYPYDNDRGRSGIEFMVYELEADVTAFKVEADQDWHVVIRGETGATMVVELPDPGCAESDDVADRFRAARHQFLRLFMHPQMRMLRLRKPVHVRIVGVAFFDRVHGQSGVAPNGIELHPVLSIEATG